MNKDKPSTLRVAILVRMFPNIVQTYVLNHILSLKNAGISTLIVAEKDPKQNEIHPCVQEKELLAETLYISTSIDTFLKQLCSIPFANRYYLTAIFKITFSKIWKLHGLKYGLKSLIRARILSSQTFDIAHSHSLFSSYDYLFLKDIFSIPMVTTYHGQVPRGVSKLGDEKTLKVLEVSDIFIVNTKFAKNELLLSGCTPDKIYVIPQGTNLSNFPYYKRAIKSNQKIKLLTVGRLSIEKGHHIAIEAISKLVNVHPSLEYHIVGDGPQKEKLIAQCVIKKIGDKVFFHGFKAGEELKEFFSSAHIFILPSINTGDGYLVETQGVVLQEAQSSGIPVIASKTGGISDVIENGKTGLLFDENDATQLAQYISQLILNPELYETLGMQARKDVEKNYSMEIICDQLMELYHKLIDKQNIA